MTAPDLDESSFELYRTILRRGFADLDEVKDVRTAGLLGRLRRLGLLHPCPERPGRLLPRDPAITIAEVLDPAEADLLRRGAEISRLRHRLKELRTEYRRLSGARNGSDLEVLGTAETVEVHLSTAAEQCTGEVLMVCTHGVPSQRTLKVSAERDFKALARGAQMKIVWQHSLIASPRLAWYLDAARELGAEIRGGSPFPSRFAIYDDVVFFPSNPVTGGGMVMTRAPALVEYFRAQHRFHWSASTPVPPADKAPEFIDGDLARDIVRLLAQGEKDEVVSRNLGVSLRTCREHIAQIMKVLSARSRFQAGVHAARAGLAGDLPRRR
ncbi:helix-turn-helix transcriptional regulator [Streptosporangium sp. NPDC051022]|uniref:helix-turn-helix transcriptional regulator n=1 Tax=Streptosporangium sp. NPDC051022 TaxID=3155752 RepID=UPI00343DE027